MPASGCCAGLDQAYSGAAPDFAQLWVVLQRTRRRPQCEDEWHRHHVEPCRGGIPQPLPRTSSERGGNMTCIDDGILRAHLDGELAGAELAEVTEHLASCGDCRARFENLAAARVQTEEVLGMLAPADNVAINPAMAYAQFTNQFAADPERKSWIERLLVPRWRPVWGLAAVALIVAVLVSVNPVRSWAQRVLAMLRVQKIQVVTIDPTTLMSGSEPDSRPYKLFNQFVADNIVVTMDPGKPAVVSNLTTAAQLTGYPIRVIGSLGAPHSVEVNGETAFQMTINRDRVATLLDEIGRSDIHIPESANGALIAVHIQIGRAH